MAGPGYSLRQTRHRLPLRGRPPRHDHLDKGIVRHALGLGLRRPSVARVYDYYLGGDAAYSIDRDFADNVFVGFPMLRDIAKANRVFLHRVVRHLVRRGITQFIDIGSGLPTMQPAHQVADHLASPPDEQTNRPPGRWGSSCQTESHGRAEFATTPRPNTACSATSTVGTTPRRIQASLHELSPDEHEDAYLRAQGDTHR
ncbi:SAM-dependent methyltransferase [Amycolatopsis cihanbeyliensis]|uniref:SAM-dependent methyltransferase n=1 Tax=Amycolatopsis cihanbeyliensis TaxID=1128664 RepID=UPI001150A60A|nr:SAM-dependent methyltransferase [Amycolatopsis cihanbeyliensis]